MMEQTLTERQDYETPPDLFDSLSLEFGPFDVDVAAHERNWKVPHYWDAASDGLAQDWTGLRCWMNPPYGRVVAKWVKKAAKSRALTVCLLPARTDPAWFHDYIWDAKHDEPRSGVVLLRFLAGRPKFWLDRQPTGKAGKFPSMIVVFDNRPSGPEADKVL